MPRRGTPLLSVESMAAFSTGCMRVSRSAARAVAASDGSQYGRPEKAASAHETAVPASRHMLVSRCQVKTPVVAE